MNDNREDLEDRFDALADEEVVRLFSSGNLTELAQSVALNELKTRRLPIPILDGSDTESLILTKLESNMRVVAEQLTNEEAGKLCGLLQAKGVPADYVNVELAEETSMASDNVCVRVPHDSVRQAMDIIVSHYNDSIPHNEVSMLIDTARK